jgi:hypothetical protein
MYVFVPTVTQRARHKKHHVEHKMSDIFEAGVVVLNFYIELDEAR